MTGSGTLVLGWGNPGRLDDGLGPAFAKALEGLGLAEVTVHSDYQLQVEMVVDVARHNRVVFVDADRGGSAPFSVRMIEATDEAPGFTTHSVSPGAILTLSRNLFDRTPEAWLVGIRGYAFDEFGEALSEHARDNLVAALDFVRAAIEQNDFRDLSIEPPNDSHHPPIEALSGGRA